jgi:Dolichyl-phosphate-mannose-protein mannosyltransferase
LLIYTVLVNILNIKMLNLEKHSVGSIPQRDSWLIIVIACFIFLGLVSWGKLAHPIFDTGQEAEITSRLLNGELLYRDLQNYYGPLPYYVNAIGMLIFGRHLEVFYGIGLALGLVATLLVYQLTKQLTNQAWAGLCTVCILIYCAFAPGGLFNLIVPYSYGTLYGTVFCLLAFWSVSRYGRSAKIGWLILAAIACGLAGISKQEYGVSGIVGLLVGVNVYPPRNVKVGIGRSILVIFVASIAALIPLTLLAQQVSWETLQASMVPFSKSQILTKSGVLDSSVSKTLDIWRHTLNIFTATSIIIWSAILCVSWLFKREAIFKGLNNKSKTHKILVEGVITIALSLFGLVLLRINVPGNIFRIGLIVLLVVCIASVANRYVLKQKLIINSQWLKLFVKALLVATFAFLYFVILRRFICCSDVVFHPLGNMAWLLPLIVIWFAFSWRQLINHQEAGVLWGLLAFSLLLNVRFLFYIGFYGIYAVTALMLFFTFLYNFAQKVSLPIWRFLLICLLIGGGINLLELAQYRYIVQSTHGVIYTKYADLATAFNKTIDYINTSGAKSVLVLPAGATLNFFTGTTSPSQETIFLPGIVPTPKAEQEFIERMKNKPPELIVYVNVPFWWLKPGYQSYAEFNPLIHQWIVQDHKLVYTSPKMTAFGNGKEWDITIYTSSK